MPLLERLRYRLRMFRIAWHVQPIRGSADDPPADPPTDPPKDPAPKADPPKDPPKDKPPWESDEDFDAERAWKLIQNTRADAEKAKKEREALAKQVKDHEDATKTDAQKLEDRATGAEQKATKATLEAARLRVALKKGLTETQAKRLVGESEEDLEKDADELLESFKAEDDDGQEPRRRPKERLRPGAAPSSEPEETNPAKLAEEVPRGW